MKYPKMFHLLAVLTSLIMGKDIGIKFTGISIDLSGAEGSDYVCERLWYDTTTDDDMVIYMKSSVTVTMSHNSDNIIVISDRVQDAVNNEGDIWYRIDGDQCVFNEKYTTFNDPQGPFNPQIYNILQFKYSVSGPFNLSAFKGKNGDNGEPEYGDKHFHYGVVDTFGDEWHTLMFWDDDSSHGGGGRSGHASDGKIVYIILDPKTPAITFTAPSGEEYYTTPPKMYYTPRIFPQISYITAGVKIRLLNMTNSESLYYRVNAGTWSEYTGEITASSIFTSDNTIYDFEYRTGTAGTVKLRKIHYTPSQPAQTEQHPRLFVSDKTALAGVVAKMTGGDADWAEWYSVKVKRPADDFLSVNYRMGRRDLKGAFNYTSYYYMIREIANKLFLTALAGVVETDEKYYKQVKEGLLFLYTVDPIGAENNDHRGGGPCNERFMYAKGRCTQYTQQAYDLLFGYTRENGYAEGMTPIEHIKIRDNLAGQAAILIKYNDGNGRYIFMVNAEKKEYGTSPRGANLEATYTALALAMPSYNTHYYGTSGADYTTPATHLYAPLLEMPVRWMDMHDNGTITFSGNPDFYNNSYLKYLFEEDGSYLGTHRVGYIRMMLEDVLPFARNRVNFDGTHYEPFENFILKDIICRYPFNGRRMPVTFDEPGEINLPRWNYAWLVTDKFKNAGLHRWHIETPTPIDIGYENYLIDKSIPAKPPAKSSYVKQSWAVLANNLADTDAVMLRIQFIKSDITKHRLYYSIGYRGTHFNICGYGERLAIEKGGYGQGDNSFLNSKARKNTILIDGENNEPYAQPRGRFLNHMLTQSLDYMAYRTINESVQNDCSFKKHDVTLYRHIFFPDKKFYIFADRLISSSSHDYDWLLHGATGGNNAADAFVIDSNSVVWTKPTGVKLAAHFLADAAISSDTATDFIEEHNSQYICEPYIKARRNGSIVYYCNVLYPVNHGMSAPVVKKVDNALAHGGFITDGSDSSTICIAMQKDFSNLQTLSFGSMSANGALVLYKETKDGTLSYFSLIRGKQFSHGGIAYVTSDGLLNTVLEKNNHGYKVVVDTVSGSPKTVSMTFGGLSSNTQYKHIVSGGTIDTFTTDATGKYSCTQQLGGKYHIIITDDLNSAVKTSSVNTNGMFSFVLLNSNIRTGSRVINFSIPRGNNTQNYQLSVVDARGRCVFKITGKYRENTMIRWDSLNSQGSVVGNGIYFVRLHMSKYNMHRKIALIK